MKSHLMGLTLSVAVMLATACTSSSTSPNAATNQNQGIGTLDGQGSGQLNVAVPQDLPDSSYFNAVSSNTDQPARHGYSGMSLVSGLYLEKASTPNVETVKVDCRAVGDTPHDNWYFYTTLTTDGVAQADQKSVQADSQGTAVNKCGDIQVNMKDLDINKTYSITVQFVYEKDNKVIVYYQGSTKPFKPKDSNIYLELKKMRLDQPVSVSLEKTPKEQCLAKGMQWDGTRCLDGWNGFQFLHSGLCLQIDKYDGRGYTGHGVQSGCTLQKNQLYRFVQQYKNSYAIQVQESGYCLTWGIDEDNHLIEAPCSYDVNTQIFTLVPTRRDKYRIQLMRQVKGKDMCVTVKDTSSWDDAPPNSADMTLPPLYAGANVALSECEHVDADGKPLAQTALPPAAVTPPAAGATTTPAAPAATPSAPVGPQDQQVITFIDSL